MKHAQLGVSLRFSVTDLGMDLQVKGGATKFEPGPTLAEDSPCEAGRGV